MVQIKAEMTHEQDSGANVYCAVCELWFVGQVQREGHWHAGNADGKPRGWPVGSPSRLSGQWGKS
eukprot:5418474-Lingulodinium_polyedra.AAC.1